MKLVTVATKPQGYFNYLLESCKRHSANIEVLEWGKEWKGFNQKYLALKEYLEQQDGNEIVCFIDAYDVILLRPLEELEREFLEFEKEHEEKIVVGHDVAYATNIMYTVSGRFIFSDCNGTTLNSGTILGRAKDIEDILKSILDRNAKPDEDDQILMTMYCKNNTGKVYIDTKQRFFMVQSYFDDEYIQRENCFIAHGPGNAYMEPLLKKLGYTVENKTHIDRLSENWKWYMDKGVHFAKILFPYILLIVLIVLFFRVPFKKE